MRAAGVLLLLALSVYGGSAAVQVKVRGASRGLEGLQMWGARLGSADLCDTFALLTGWRKELSFGGCEAAEAALQSER